MEIKLYNRGLNPELSIILNEATELLKANQKDVSIEKTTTNIKNTKGEILTSVFITVFTTVSSEIIIYLIKEAIKRHFDKHKKTIRIETKNIEDTDTLEIEFEETDSEIVVIFEE